MDGKDEDILRWTPNLYNMTNYFHGRNHEIGEKMEEIVLMTENERLKS